MRYKKNGHCGSVTAASTAAIAMDKGGQGHERSVLRGRGLPSAKGSPSLVFKRRPITRPTVTCRPVRLLLDCDGGRGQSRAIGSHRSARLAVYAFRPVNCGARHGSNGLAYCEKGPTRPLIKHVAFSTNCHGRRETTISATAWSSRQRDAACPCSLTAFICGRGH